MSSNIRREIVRSFAETQDTVTLSPITELHRMKTTGSCFFLFGFRIWTVLWNRRNLVVFIFHDKRFWFLLWKYKKKKSIYRATWRTRCSFSGKGIEQKDSNIVDEKQIRRSERSSSSIMLIILSSFKSGPDQWICSERHVFARGCEIHFTKLYLFTRILIILALFVTIRFIRIPCYMKG